VAQRAITGQDLRGASAQLAAWVPTRILHGMWRSGAIVDREIIRVPAGTLEDDPGVRPQRHIFVDFEAPWFQITDALDQFGTKPKPD
jgi:hypothetical protein